MDAMFYIQASTKQQASYIFSTLSPKPTANCQLTDLQNETVVPSISRKRQRSTVLTLIYW